MANPEILDRVYAAIGSLRAKGVCKLNVDLVAKSAGVARSTFYLKDPDWNAVREVISGKPSERVKLVEVQIEEKTVATREIEFLYARVAEAEEKIVHIESTAGKVYQELIDEVQKWFYEASQTPAKKQKYAQLINELNSTRLELERLRAENSLLKAESGNGGAVRPLIQKAQIHLNTLDSPGNFFSSFLKQLEKIVYGRGNLHDISGVYVLCGLPCSGKTRWIGTHQPSSPGVYLYIDSCAHSADVRRFIAERVRETTKVEVHCVWVRADETSCSERVSSVAIGAAASLKEIEIREISSLFEKPTFDEPFSSFILP